VDPFDVRSWAISRFLELGVAKTQTMTRVVAYYSLHPLLIAIFQNFKCSKMIAIFAIDMGCCNK